MICSVASNTLVYADRHVQDSSINCNYLTPTSALYAHFLIQHHQRDKKNKEAIKIYIYHGFDDLQYYGPHISKTVNRVDI